MSNIHHGKRHDIPMDVWELLLETVTMFRAEAESDGDAA